MIVRTFHKTSAYNRANITELFKRFDINSSLNKCN